MDDTSEQQSHLSDWRQGDFCLDATLEIPILNYDDGGAFFGPATGRGMLIVSQSCDIVRDSVDRPYVQVSPLLEATAEELAAVANKRRPQYATFEALAGLGLVVDLDLVASVHKQVVASWERAGGCASEAERAGLAESLARHKQRFGFPDGFDLTLKDFRRWIERRANQNNDSGSFIRAIDEIRVRCDDWDADPLALEFICILKADPPVDEREGWEVPRADLESKITPKCPDAFVRVTSKGEISLIEYQESHFLDLDGLSDA